MIGANQNPEIEHLSLSLSLSLCFLLWFAYRNPNSKANPNALILDVRPQAPIAGMNARPPTPILHVF